MQPVPVALTTLATLALFAGAMLPLRRYGALVSDLNDRFHEQLAAAGERIVPVTRRRLRPAAGPPTWPAMLPYAIDAGSSEERTTALRALLDGPEDPATGTILAAIAREEQGELRVLAFRSLIAQKYAEGREVFCDALRSGSDAERSLAIDGLARLQAFDELTEAFADRLEPLAAKAVLLYAASRDRARIVDALDDRVEPARRDAILKLLAGIIE